ncbi:CoA-transferase [Burkholderia cepacia]|uniref:CoA-transferase n=1 Tax=Burkholderia cepacia TaxID=292 RepID=UPI001CF5005C|nr:CoA-transferase [Burkholderia cepacia]MCA8350736.1 succinyl-CoA--3-ketoacid-CoA transferase [Burkholderia cepacia]
MDIGDRIARRAARALRGTRLVNLGIGIPCRIARYLNAEKVLLQSETGFIGYTPADTVRSDNAWAVDKQCIDAGGNLIELVPGGCHTGISETFALMRSDRIDVSVLGAYQVDQQGFVASIGRSERSLRGYGGAMDLFVGARRIVIAMSQVDGDGYSKIARRLCLPRTSQRPADLVITEMATFELLAGNLTLVEVAPEYHVSEVLSRTDAEVKVSSVLASGWDTND